jgi:lysophospholipase L1-like esterase
MNLKPIVIVLSLLAVNISMAQNRVTTIPANDSNVRYTGRTMVNSDNSVSFDWSGTYFETIFTGGYCAVRVSDSRKNYYNLFIDGEFIRVVTTHGKDSTIVLAKGLAGKQHLLRMQKRSEAEQGRTTVHSFDLEKGASLVSYFPSRARHIEFIGNSITAGYGTEGKVKTEPFKAETENCNLAYGAIISRYFDADYTFIAHSGRGAVRNYGDKNRVSKNTMRERMMNTFDEDSTFKWDFKGYKPDLIVINLGSNDFSTNPHPLREEFLGAYSEILLRLRGVYGADVPVLCVAPPKGPAFDFIRDFVRDSKDAKLGFAAYLNGVYNDGSDQGSSGHPNYEGQKKIAMNLIPYISTLTGWPLTGKVIE